MKLRDTRGRYTTRSRWLLNATVYLLALSGILSGVNWAINWYADKYVEVPTEIISPVAEEEPELSEWEQFLNSLEGVERKICDRFPVDQCRIALAVSGSENGARNPEALHANLNGSFDVGIWQINSVHWDSDYCPGLHELTTEDANIECGYQIWDRCDPELGPMRGELNDGVGCYYDWTDFNNGKFTSKL